MTIYLVDMENIPHAWANLLDICGGDDRIVLFYTDRVSQVPLILMEKVTKSRVEMEYIKCYDGPNGLDFQLVTEMGYRIAQNPEADYVIVSQDHGFDVVVQYWSGRGARAKRIVPSGGRPGGVFPQYTSGGGIEFRDVDVSNPQNVKEFLCWKLSNKVPKKEIVTISEILLEAMEQGDLLAAEIFDTVGEFLGRGLSLLIDILNPERIVIGSIYARQKEALEKRMMEVIEEEALKASAGVCRILPASLGEQIGDYAAVSVGIKAYEELYSNGTDFCVM